MNINDLWLLKWFYLTTNTNKNGCFNNPFFPSQSFMVSESEALLKETLMPVYVVPEDEQLLYMYEEVKQAAATRTSSIFIRGERSKRIFGWALTVYSKEAEKTICMFILWFVWFHFWQSFEVW